MVGSSIGYRRSIVSAAWHVRAAFLPRPSRAPRAVFEDLCFFMRSGNKTWQFNIDQLVAAIWPDNFLGTVMLVGGGGGGGGGGGVCGGWHGSHLVL